MISIAKEVKLHELWQVVRMAMYEDPFDPRNEAYLATEDFKAYERLYLDVKGVDCGLRKLFTGLSRLA